MSKMLFSVEVNAPKENVWNIMWQDTTFREWGGIIDEGTYLKGELKEGNQVEFLSSVNGYGVTSLVEKLIPAEFLVLRHTADTQDTGKLMREEQWTGSTETYSLKEKDGITTLTVEFDVPQELENYFKETYPKALNKVKELSERIS